MQTHEQDLTPPLQRSAQYDVARGWLSDVVRFLQTEVRTWMHALSLPTFYVIMAMFAVVLMLAVHLPLNYTIDVGKEEGYGSDLPYLQGFNTAERDVHGSYRWTDDGAIIRLPGLGRRSVLVQLHFFPISAQVAEAGPQVIEVWSDSEQQAVLPVRADGAFHTLAIPAHVLDDGTLTLTLRTTTFTLAGDPRQLGTPLDRITISSTQSATLVAPDWRAGGLWLLAALLCWVMLVRTLKTEDWLHPWTIRLFAGGVALVALAAILDPPRWAFGAWPAVVTFVCAYGLALTLRPLLVMLANRLRIALDAQTTGWLVLIIVVAFAMRFGGRLYPRSMHGDIGYHTNRFYDTVLGLIYLLSRNRGVDFPYPSGPYLTLAPLTLLGIDTPVLIQLAATLADSLGAALVFAIVVWTGQAIREWRIAHGMPVSSVQIDSTYRTTGLLAAAIYVFAAAGFMTNWWSFSTHIYAQFATLVAITALVYICLHSHERNDLRRSVLVLVVIMSGVFLGHFGFFINMALLTGFVLMLIWLAAWRGDAWSQRLRMPLTMAYGAALGIAGLFFYSAYLPLFINQMQAVVSGGLTGLAERAPVTRAYLWRILWDSGLIIHFGFFPLILAPLGVALLAQRERPAWMLAILMAGTFLISSFFAVLPFITLSTQSTRWLMFSAWAVAIGAALAVQWLWRFGRAGKLAVIVMTGFVLWNTAVIWLGGMLWRIRPPEPF